MTTSNELYVWTWLPGQIEPVLAGRIDRAGPLYSAIDENWDEARDVARLRAADKKTPRKRPILPRATFFDY